VAALRAQAAALGLPAGWAERMLGAAADEPETVLVLPVNVPAVRAFQAMASQWRRGGMAGLPTGLDLTVLPMVARALRIRITEDLLMRLRLIENAVIGVMVEKIGVR